MSGKNDDLEPLVAVARAVRTRGLKGEIVADLLTDFPERFEGLEELVTVAPDGKRGVIELEQYWFQKDRVILKFKGFDNLEASSGLIGYEFAVPESARVPLEEDEYYDWELQGCTVETIEGESVGKVAGILKTGGVAMLEVDAGRELLIPMAETIVTEINIPEKRIVIDPPEGLLDL
ncbi:MAG TPA: ribosome maturation factor RimM [Pyrinomonadaceae bacterium]|jgi:16S rRNA processing protein RimM